MIVRAVRDDGALLVVTDDDDESTTPAVVIDDEGSTWPTSVGAALARGVWSDPGRHDRVPANLERPITEALSRLARELPRDDLTAHD